MRKKFKVQYELGATPVEEIQIPIKSRDEVPAVLRALQHIYKTPKLHEKVFNILEKKVMSGINPKTGRPGMSLWEIFVFAAIRLARDADYDHLEYIANYDSLVRKLVGISDFGENLKSYSLQTLKDNIGLLDEQTLDEINEIIAKTGHKLKKNEELNVKVDTYVLETTVHFPTDLNLLLDAGRKSIDLISQIAKEANINIGWRKHKDWNKRLKIAYHQTAKRTLGIGRHTPKGFDAANNYLTIAENLSKKIKSSKELLQEISSEGSCFKYNKFINLLYYEKHLDKHIDLVRRRLIYGQTIPHEEKIFSLFEPHTEWIKKGKAGNKVELGLRIAVATDQYGFILHHKIMKKIHDVDIAVPFTKELLEKYPNIVSVSFDKGCWSPGNYKTLNELVENVILPKKGKLNTKEQEREQNKKFKALRRLHTTVESDINCLEHHGLNKCPDKGMPNFRKYTSIGVVAYSLHKLGNILIKEDRIRLSKNKKIPIAA